MYAVFINCRCSPFIDWIISGQKPYETRSRNVLAPLIGKTVYLAETGKGSAPVVRAVATIASAASVPFDDVGMRDAAMITGTAYDIRPGCTKVFYRLADVRPVSPFPLPSGRINHGRSYTEF